MGVIEGREFEEKCPKSTEALELPYWFAGNGVIGDTNYNEKFPKMGTYVWKRGLHEINIGGADETTFRFEVRMLHGLYQNATRRGFLDSMCIDTVYPERGNKKEFSSVPHSAGEQRRDCRSRLTSRPASLISDLSNSTISRARKCRWTRPVGTCTPR